jgi:CNT family concentrative nucleoside transporter
MGASGAESLNVAASIFMGQTEAPVTIRPFLPDLTRSELMTVMTSGMAHVSGGSWPPTSRSASNPNTCSAPSS